MAGKKAAQKKKVVVIARPPNSNWARIVFGTLEESSLKDGTATLSGARQCIYYSKETGGELGLAAIGPQAGSSVSPVLPGNVVLTGVGAVMDCSAAAITAWGSFK